MFVHHYVTSFVPVHWRGVLKHIDALATQFVQEKGQELGELGLYRFYSHIFLWEVICLVTFHVLFPPRNCLLHVATLHQEGLISGETAFNCVIILQVRFLFDLL